MPLSFGSLLGGLVTMVGTSPNIIVSRLRGEMLGEPFRMFDFAPVGLSLTVVGILFLTVGWRLLPEGRKGGATADLFAVEDYQTEVRLPPESPLVGKSVADLEGRSEGDVEILGIIREEYRRYTPSADWELLAGDVLVLQGDAQALQRIIAEGKLELVHDKAPPPNGGNRAERRAEFTSAEAVVAPDSPMVGRTMGELRLRDRFGVNVLALSRRGERVEQRMRRVRFQAGDLLVLRLPTDDMADRLAALGCLPLAERHLLLGTQPRMWLPIIILAGAMALAASGMVSVAVAFFGAAVLMLLVGALRMDEVYGVIDWPVLALLGALIPISEALRTTGGTELIAGWLSAVAADLPTIGAIALVLVASMAVTPFLNNAATVLVLAPIAASLAVRLDLSPDAFLMAVAVGAACDFLTPIGHQCNTLVMGPGGYRFADYWKLGLPLSILVATFGTLLIGYFWPVQ